ncbi:hypothetical protein PAMP_010688 [Pampus punctatissimus]
MTKHKVLVVSVCPQSLPFFAVKFGLDITEAALKLCSFLKSLGVQYVFDTTLAAGFSILETQKEFIQRYRGRHHDSHALPMFTSSCPGEIFYLMEQKKVSVEKLDSVPLDHVLGEAGDVALVRHEGRGSEGFLEHVFKHAAKELFGLDVHEITYKTLRNRDFQEVTLERDGETLLQFAAVYGFRNIQTLVHRMRKGRVPYQLVEVLSCPGGCLSGRGQAESEAGGRADKTLVQQMEETYSSLPVCLPEVNPTLHTLYQDWLQGQDSPQAGTLLHTQYTSQSQMYTQPPHMQW